MRYAALFGALVAGLLAYSAYWFSLAARIETGVAEWVDARRAEGVNVTFDTLEVTGFPYRMQPEFTNLRISGGTGMVDGGTWEVHTGSLSANVLPYDLNHIVVRLPAPLDILLMRPEQAPDTYRLVPENALASVVIAPEPESRLAVDVAGGTLTGTGIDGTVTMGRTQLHARRGNPDIDTPPLFEISARIDGLVYPGFSGSALGESVTHLALTAGITGAMPPQLDKAGVRQWRDAGGGVQISALEIDWGPLDMTAAGSLALDDETRPTGSLTTKINGYEDLVNALRTAGQLSQAEARAANTALAIVALAAGGPRGTLSLPLILQDGHIFLGPVRIAALPPLAR